MQDTTTIYRPLNVVIEQQTCSTSTTSQPELTDREKFIVEIAMNSFSQHSEVQSIKKQIEDVSLSMNGMRYRLVIAISLTAISLLLHLFRTMNNNSNT